MAESECNTTQAEACKRPRLPSTISIGILSPNSRHYRRQWSAVITTRNHAANQFQMKLIYIFHRLAVVVAVLSVLIVRFYANAREQNQIDNSRFTPNPIKLNEENMVEYLVAMCMRSFLICIFLFRSILCSMRKLGQN